ncbi:MAG: methyltransferase domain-containing protein, partial [Aestuariivirga sp.]
GLITRHKEGNWVLFRLREEGRGGALSRALVDMLPGRDNLLSDDLSRLEIIRIRRQQLASKYFATNAAQWQKLRSLHVQEAEVEAAFLAVLGTAKYHLVLDLGTGTGRMLELLAGRSVQAWGIDESRDMLAVARANLQKAGLKNAQVRQADIYALPFADASADLISIHQVLHYLDDPQRALLEARRVLKSGGRIIIVDFAPHELEELRSEHAHRRLGISAEQMAGFLTRAGLVLKEHRVLPPPWLKSGPGLTVSLWLAELPATQNNSTPLKKAMAQ